MPQTASWHQGCHRPPDKYVVSCLQGKTIPPHGRPFLPYALSQSKKLYISHDGFSYASQTPFPDRPPSPGFFAISLEVLHSSSLRKDPFHFLCVSPGVPALFGRNTSKPHRSAQAKALLPQLPQASFWRQRNLQKAPLPCPSAHPNNAHL